MIACSVGVQSLLNGLKPSTSWIDGWYLASKPAFAVHKFFQYMFNSFTWGKTSIERNKRIVPCRGNALSHWQIHFSNLLEWLQSSWSLPLFFGKAVKLIQPMLSLRLLYHIVPLKSSYNKFSSICIASLRNKSLSSPSDQFAWSMIPVLRFCEDKLSSS